jgi:THO complex subunit 3
VWKQAQAHAVGSPAAPPQVHSVAWNCTGRKLASGSVDRTARIWDIHHVRLCVCWPVAPRDAQTQGKGDKAEAELKGHTDGVDQLCWHPSQADQLATASGDKTVRFWDARSAKCVAAVATSGENINVAWSPDGLHVAVGNRDDVITTLDVRTHRTLSATKFDFEVNEFAWAEDGQRFFVTTGLGTVEVLGYPLWGALHTLQAHTAGCYCLALDPSAGGLLAVGGADALVSVWALDELCCLRTLPRLEKPVRALSFSHDGQFLAAGSQDPFIDISLAASGERAARLETRAEMNSLAWNPRALLLAYATSDEGRPDAEGVVHEVGSGSGSLRVWGVPG